MIQTLRKAIQIKDVRNKILFTLAILAIFRFLAHIPVPNVDVVALKEMFGGNQLFNLLNVFSGGGLQNLSVVAVGISPYITASIIIQLMVFAIPQFEELSKEGAYGKAKIAQYTQWLTLPIAVLQAYGLYFLLASAGTTGVSVFPPLNSFDLFVVIASFVAGSFLLMWMSTLLTEFGVGNGASLIVFAGILSGVVSNAAGTLAIFDASNAFNLIMFAVLAVVVIAAVVYINEAFRKIHVQYSSRYSQMSGDSFIPIKINQAGVIPIIFAVTMIMFPFYIGNYLQTATNPFLSQVGEWLRTNFSPTALGYNATYFFLVFGFTYLYTSFSFNPSKIADDIRKSGGYILGVRPGSSTVNYLKYIINRITLAGGLFLGLVAILPYALENATGVSTLAVGGTGLLIVVSVVLETVKQIDSWVITKEYDRVG